jgi:hypothetical protein
VEERILVCLFDLSETPLPPPFGLWPAAPACAAQISLPGDQTTLTGLPLGDPLTVTIIAHNTSGDGPESEAANITLG